MKFASHYKLDHTTTPKEVFVERRKFIKGAMALGLLPIQQVIASPHTFDSNKQCFDVGEQLATSQKKHVQSYNNYYEFSTDKQMVKHLAREFKTEPWQVRVSGLVESPLSVSLEDLKSFTSCRRTYRLRCVEGWSAVIPWHGFELNQLLSLVKPLPNARYVKFKSLHDPKQMINQRNNLMPWPYTEGLRLDEAMHPLTILATGMYNEALAKQNGAPIRLVVPWKYGFKSIKAITEIELVDTQPISSWSQSSPSEYGFYANVNPNVAHPRWNQRRELPLGAKKKIKTQLLNGYYDEVRDLYQNDVLDSLF